MHSALVWFWTGLTWLQGKSLQLCLTLCDPVDSSPPDSSLIGFSMQEHWSGLPFPPPRDLPYPGIKYMSLLSPVLAGRFFTTSTSWKPCPPSGNLSNPGIKTRSPALQADSLLTEPPGKPKNTGLGRLSLLQRIFPTRNQTGVSCNTGGFFTSWASREAPSM